MNADYWLRNYNTELSPEQETAFQGWLARQSGALKRNLAADLADYDLRGFYLNSPNLALTSGHLPDTYKKPNHPTFSEESIYNGTIDPYGGKFAAGRWIGDDENGWSYQPSQRMLSTTHNREAMKQYFAEHEPDSVLVFPTVNLRK